MKLNENTLDVLRNFASIQPNLLVESGAKVRTMAESRTIMAEVTLDQELPSDFVIYDLSEFLSTMNLMEDPELDFKDEHVLMVGNGGRIKVKYYFAAESMITTVKKTPNMPEAEVKLNLDESTLQKLNRASSVLGHEFVMIQNSDDDSNAILSVTDPKNTTSNEFKVEVPAEFESGVPFNFIINIKHIKVLPGNYNVHLSSKLLAKFENTTTFDIDYFIAMEKSSKYGE